VAGNDRVAALVQRVGGVQRVTRADAILEPSAFTCELKWDGQRSMPTTAFSTARSARSTTAARRRAVCERFSRSLRGDLRDDAWNIHTVLERLRQRGPSRAGGPRRKDPWAGYFSARQRLPRTA